MTREEVLAELKEVVKVVRPALDLDTVTFDTRLVEDLGLDSLSMLLVAMALENRFGIRFDSQQQFQTVTDACDAVLDLLNN